MLARFLQRLLWRRQAALPTGPVNYRVDNMAGGDDTVNPTRADLRAYLDEVDEFHPRAWLDDTDGRTLSYWMDGRITYTTDQSLEDLDDDHFDPFLYDGQTGHARRLEQQTPRDALRLWTLMMAGEYATLEELPWIDGLISEKTEQAMIAYAQAVEHDLDQQFLDVLGPEVPGELCKKPDCGLERIKFSVFCKRHHFEMLKGRLPFERVDVPVRALLMGVRPRTER
ncbi:MAG: hypothetical protein AAGF99_02620 [Bacteroidota bacterium]